MRRTSHLSSQLKVSIALRQRYALLGAMDTHFLCERLQKYKKIEKQKKI